MSHIETFERSFLWEGIRVTYTCYVEHSDEIVDDESVQGLKPGRHKRGRASYTGIHIYKKKRDMDRAMDANEVANIEEAVAFRLREYQDAGLLSSRIVEHDKSDKLWDIWREYKDKLLSSSGKYDDLLEQFGLPEID